VLSQPRRKDEPVHGEWQQPGCEASLAVGSDEFIGVPVADYGRDCGDGCHGEGDGDPDEPVSLGRPPAAIL